MFHSFRTRLQTAFVLLGVSAIAFTGWQASSGATEALREATYDRLNAIRETRARQIERYFTDVRDHVLALSTDESTIDAIEQFTSAWDTLPTVEQSTSLHDYYESNEVPETWFPQDPRARALQSLYIARNPHPHGAKDLLVSVPEAGRYGTIHTRYHPTFHRYQMAFGFYDIFLLGPGRGHVLYTVMKEADLGVPLTEAPYSETGLARVYQRAFSLDLTDEPVIVDYTPYAPSSYAPAAFVAAPVRRAGETVGVLAIQVSIGEINEVMTGGGRWMEEGLGRTGQSYVAGPDGTLRSDLRFALEDPEAYYRDLAGAGISDDLIEQIRRHRTGVLAFPVNLSISQTIREGEGATEIGRGLHGEEVLRSHSQLNIGGLSWTLVAEIGTEEAFAPVVALRNRIAGAGLLIAALFFLAAGWIGASVTRPVRALAFAARRLGQGDLDARIHIKSPDEIGQLAADFNRMVEDLQRTTVSKAELQVLAGRLITAQEDERARLARELHDDMTQRLAAVAIEIGRLAKEQDSAALARLKTDMARISDDIHSLSRGLHPRVLDDLGLAAAVEAECRAFFERGGPLTEFDVQGDLGDLPRDTQLALYRITQEALNNILRHAEASAVEIHLHREPDAVNLTIRDNGRGFDSSHADWHAGLGLASMEERTRLIGGTFHVMSKPGRGTTIEVSLPLGPLS